MRNDPRVALSCGPTAPFLVPSQVGARHRARLAPVRSGVYGGRGGEKACRGPARGCGGIEREGAMSWTKPAFEEIKMDAEAKSYSDGIIW